MADVKAIQINIDEHYKQCVMALQQIAQLADTGSKAHKERFCVYDKDRERWIPNIEVNGEANGWRVAEACDDYTAKILLSQSEFRLMNSTR